MTEWASGSRTYPAALSALGVGMLVADTSERRLMKSLKVDYVTIDGDFVEVMPSSPLDRALVESIKQIAHGLQIQTAAESVASADLYAWVEEIGVDHVQGFWVATPQPILAVCTQPSAS